MATKNLRVSVELHTELKMTAMLKGTSLQDYVNSILYKELDSEKYKDEDGNPIDMTNHDQIFLDRFGGDIPPDSDMSFREYVEFVKEKEGVLRPYE